MTDTYYSSTDKAALCAFSLSYPNVIGPISGRKACAGTVDANGNSVAATMAAGDPALFYICIRTNAAVSSTELVALVDTETGSSVLGVWA